MLLNVLVLLVAAAKSSAVMIQGRIKPNQFEVQDYRSMEVYLDGGYTGFVQADGQFTIHNVPIGTTYIMKVKSPKLTYPPIRLDVNTSGKIRARKLNILTLKDVELIPYPLELEPMQQTPYFQKREQFSIFDTLKSPMVLFMLLPMVVLFLLPKLLDMQDPELKKEMEEQMKTMNKGGQVPDMSELMSSIFGGQPAVKKSSKSSKKKN